MKKNGRRLIRQLGMTGDRRVAVQRYVCLRCGQSFSLRKERWQRYSQAMKLEVARRHVERRESYRVIAKGVQESSGRKVSPSSLQQMVQEVAERCKTPLEMSRELKPRWDGFLELDEKEWSVRGTQQWFYLAVDRTGDIMHCREVEELTVNEAIDFVEEVKEVSGGRCRGIVTDLDTVLRLAVGIVYPGKPHQFCLKHALEALERKIGYTSARWYHRANVRLLRNQFIRLRDRKGVWAERARAGFARDWDQSRGVSDRYRQIAALRDQCHRILFAKTEPAARKQMQQLERSPGVPRKRKRKVIRFLKEHWENLMAYHRIPGLPRTTNLIEAVNKQIERRFKTIEAFQHRWTGRGYMNLLVAYLRLKPYTDCRRSRRHLNGHSRLHAAGVKHLPKDWLKTCIKNA